MPSKPSNILPKFTADELQQVFHYVSLFGEYSWDKIASLIGNQRKALDCLRVYVKRKSRETPETNKLRKWTPEEDRLLVERVKKCGEHQWSKIALSFIRRTANHCHHRWLVLNKRKKGRWTKEEDMLLLEGVKNLGERNWVLIQKYIPGRDASQCRERYMNSLNTRIKRGKWDENEERALINLIYTHGIGNWAFLASKMKNRTDSSVKRKYAQLLKSGSISMYQLPNTQTK